MSYKIVAKKASPDYSSGGAYPYPMKDHKETYEDFMEALQAFLDWAADGDTKVSLTFKPEKGE